MPINFIIDFITLNYSYARDKIILILTLSKICVCHRTNVNLIFPSYCNLFLYFLRLKLIISYNSFSIE